MLRFKVKMLDHLKMEFQCRRTADEENCASVESMKERSISKKGTLQVRYADKPSVPQFSDISFHWPSPIRAFLRAEKGIIRSCETIGEMICIFNR